jgi:hypothetical protein
MALILGRYPAKYDMIDRQFIVAVLYKRIDICVAVKSPGGVGVEIGE